MKNCKKGKGGIKNISFGTIDDEGNFHDISESDSVIVEAWDLELPNPIRTITVRLKT